MTEQFLSAAELGSCLSEIEIITIQHLPRHAPYTIIGVSRSQLSVARYAGGCRVYGERYRYMPDTDELVREDVWRFVERHRKLRANVARTAAKEQAKQAQGDLL